MREINRVKDALEWCNKALDMMVDPELDDGFKFGYANAALIIIRSKLTRELLYQKALDDELRGVDPDFAKI